MNATVNFVGNGNGLKILSNDPVIDMGIREDREEKLITAVVKAAEKKAAVLGIFENLSTLFFQSCGRERFFKELENQGCKGGFSEIEISNQETKNFFYQLSGVEQDIVKKVFISFYESFVDSVVQFHSSSHYDIFFEIVQSEWENLIKATQTAYGLGEKEVFKKFFNFLIFFAYFVKSKKKIKELENLAKDIILFYSTKNAN